MILRLVAVPFTAAACVLLLAGEGHSQSPGTITGTAFFDRNADGVRDPSADEFGLANREVTLSGAAVRTTQTDSNGVYAFAGVAAGTYTIAIELDIVTVIPCSEQGGFSPLRVASCVPPSTEHWEPTSPDSVAVTVAAGATEEVNFGAGSPTPEIVKHNVALLGGDWAPIGTEVRAEYHGVECGLTTVHTQGGTGLHTFSLPLLDESSRAGCPPPGQIWNFRVGGVLASQTLISNSDQPFEGLTAMPEHAWYWVEEPVTGNYTGGFVTAKVGNVTCGSAQIEETVATALGTQRVVGFQRLVVPSATISSGCGSPGASVTFNVGGAVTTVPWTPGLQRISLPVNELVLVVDGPTAFPPLGREPADNDADAGRGISPIAFALGMAAVVFGFGLMWLGLKRRST